MITRKVIPQSYRSFIGPACVLLGAICFSSKAIFIKIAYELGVNSTTLLMLRMVFALPVYLFILMFSAKSQNRYVLQKKDYPKLAILGIAGYYVASWLDFEGLKYVSASIERLLLFIYPTLVLIISAVFLKKKIKKEQTVALILTYMGIALIFIAKDQEVATKDMLTGGAFIFMAALTYAIYLIGSGELLPRIGTVKYTSYAMLFSALAIIVHYLLLHPLDVLSLDPKVYILGIILAIIATVIPSFLISEGIRRMGSGDASILASVGPVSTIVLAYLFLGEKLTTGQSIGAFFVIAGVLLITIKGKG